MKTTNSDWMIAANKPYNEITPEEMARIHDRIQNHDEVPIIEEVSNKTIRQRLSSRDKAPLRVQVLNIWLKTRSYSVSKFKKFIGLKYNCNA